MLVELKEVTALDNKAIGPVWVNPRHVVSVRRAPNVDPELAILITLVEDVNRKVIRVEGTPTDVASKLGR